MKIKRIICLVLVAVLCLGTCSAALATEGPITVLLDGRELLFDVPPQLINDRTMVPMRMIFESMGASVEWDDATSTVTAHKEGTVINLTIGSNVIYKNGTPIAVDVPAQLIDDRTLVPVRVVSESLGCNVDWIDATNTVVITSSVTASTTPQNSTNEENAQATPSSTVQFNEYSFKPTRTVDIQCTNIIKGSQANSIIESENQFNDDPSKGQEWIIMEFDVKYISSTDGDNDMLKGSDIIYKDTFFTSSKRSMVVHDMATLGDRYGGYGVFDVEMYPGSSAKIVIGLLIDSYAGDIFLRVPSNAGEDITWINIGNSDNVSSGATLTDSQLADSHVSSGLAYYPGTSVPTYTEVTGIALSRTSSLDSGDTVYIYKNADSDMVSLYWEKLFSLGWELLSGDDKSTTDIYETSFYKGDNLVIVDIVLLFDEFELWIVPSVVE